MDMTPQTWPEWYDGRHINEVLFCQQFLDKHPMKCVRGRLFTVDGLIEDPLPYGSRSWSVTPVWCSKSRKRARNAKHWLPRKRHCQYTM